MFVSRVGSQNKPSFGWNWSTHKEIDRRLINEYNRLLPKNMAFDDELLVEKGSVDPDLDRKKIVGHIHGHFADVDNLSKIPPDAYNLAIQYTKKATDAHKVGNYAKRDLYIGYATHFIADSLQPYHAVKFVHQRKGHPIRKAHKIFENTAEGIQKYVFDSVNINVLDDTMPFSFFEDVLPKAMRKSKELYEKIATGNYDNKVSVVASALDNTYKTVNLYFKSLLNEFAKKGASEIIQNYYKIAL